MKRKREGEGEMERLGLERTSQSFAVVREEVHELLRHQRRQRVDHAPNTHAVEEDSVALRIAVGERRNRAIDVPQVQPARQRQLHRPPDLRRRRFVQQGRHDVF